MKENNQTIGDIVSGYFGHSVIVGDNRHPVSWKSTVPSFELQIGMSVIGIVDPKSNCFIITDINKNNLSK